MEGPTSTSLTSPTSSKPPSWIGTIPSKLVADVSVEPVQNSYDLELYNSVGKTSYLSSIPSNILFEGFKIDEYYTLTVNILNISVNPVNFDILPLNSDIFKLRYSKKGIIPAGIIQPIYIDFYPLEYKVYTDNIRIHGLENLIIPIKATPIPNFSKKIDNKSLLPSRIDLGYCELGNTINYDLNIPNPTPLPLEYKFISDETVEFEFEPLNNIIEPYSNGNLNIIYKPAYRATSNINLKFIPLNGSECNINILAYGMKMNDTPQLLNTSNQWVKNLHSSKPKAVNSISNVNINYSDKESINACLRTILSKGEIPLPKDLYDDKTVNIKFDYEKYEGVKNVNKILLQEEGAMDLKEKKKASLLSRQRQEEKASEILSASMMNTNMSASELTKRGISIESERFNFSFAANNTVEFIGDQKQMKQIIFDRYVKDLQEYESKLLLQVRLNRIGQVLLNEDDIQGIKDDWKKEEKGFITDLNLIARNNHQLQLSSAPVVHSICAGNPEEIYDIKSTCNLDVANNKPDFDPFKSDNWKLRKQTNIKFQKLISYLILDNRLGTRIEAAQKHLKSNNLRQNLKSRGSRTAEVKAKPKSDNSLPVEFNFSVSDIAKNSMPIPESGNAIRTKTNAFDAYKFVDLVPFELPVPDDWKLQGYNIITPAPVANYTNIEKHRKLRKGAYEEDPFQSLSNAIAKVAEEKPDTIKALLAGPIPKSVLLSNMPHPLTFIRSSEGLPPFPLNKGDEMDPAAVFNDPDMYPDYMPARLNPPNASYMTEDTGYSSLKVLSSFPTLLQSWQPTFLNIPFETPSLLDQLQKDDIYSDSESDDDEEGLKYKPLLPTSVVARSLFDNEVPLWSPMDKDNKLRDTTSKVLKNIIPVAEELKETSHETATTILKRDIEKTTLTRFEDAAKAVVMLNSSVTDERFKTRPLMK